MGASSRNITDGIVDKKYCSNVNVKSSRHPSAMGPIDASVERPHCGDVVPVPFMIEIAPRNGRNETVISQLGDWNYILVRILCRLNDPYSLTRHQSSSPGKDSPRSYLEEFSDFTCNVLAKSSLGSCPRSILLPGSIFPLISLM
jgi:hypothetical protein